MNVFKPLQFASLLVLKPDLRLEDFWSAEGCECDLAEEAEEPERDALGAA